MVFNFLYIFLKEIKKTALNTKAEADPAVLAQCFCTYDD
jgi:hypothetical protein